MIELELIRDERDRWFSQTFHARAAPQDEKLISTSALLLEMEIRIAFLAGAWLSVIVLAAAAIEAQFRHVFSKDYETEIYKLYGTDRNLHWLREFRNEAIHVKRPGARSTLWKANPNNLLECHAALEADSRRAVEIMFQTIYSSNKPGTHVHPSREAMTRRSQPREVK